MELYSVAFAGTPKFACPSLQALHDDPSFDVKLVITQPDRPVGRKQVITAPPVKELAEKLGIEVMQPEDINSIQHSALSTQPDFLVVVAYGQMLSKELLNWPTIAPVNVHASLLPTLRGASPIQHSILLDHKQSGITIQRMAKELDSGPILAQQIVQLDRRETSSSLHDRLSALGADLLVKTLKEPLKETEQDHGRATFCGKLSRDLGVTDPKIMTAEGIDRKVRALVPWPGVKMAINGKEVKIIETSLESSDDALKIECNENTKLYITKLQAPGKNMVSGAEWQRTQM